MASVILIFVVTTTDVLCRESKRLILLVIFTAALCSPGTSSSTGGGVCSCAVAACRTEELAAVFFEKCGCFRSRQDCKEEKGKLCSCHGHSCYRGKSQGSREAGASCS